MAGHDGLMGLSGQGPAARLKGQALAEAAGMEPCAVLVVDLDQFRSVRDRVGHQVANALIRQFADRLRDVLPPDGCLSHIGGDEFAIVLTKAPQPDGAVSLAERVLADAARPFLLGGHPVIVGVTIGIAAAARPDATTDRLFADAYTALCRAKTDARGGYLLFTPDMDSHAIAGRGLAWDLQNTASTMSFELAYQPQVEIRSGRVKVVEALLRWPHPVRGHVPPISFIPLAEELGLIAPIGEWVLREACREAATWPGDVSVAVNVSGSQFAMGALPDMVADALRDSGLPPSRLELEITESVLIEDNAVTQNTLRGLRDAGIRIAIDDFGIGYSSLSYLTTFLFDKLKLDRSFVSGPASFHDRRAIIRAVVGLCASLGINCTAEGVETQEQLAMLESENCPQAQGFLLSRPLAPNAIRSLLLTVNVGDPAEAPAPALPTDERSFFQIAEVANDIIIVTTPDLDFPGPLIVYTNPAFTRLTGYTAAEVLGRSPRMLQGFGTDRLTTETIGADLRAGRVVQERLLNFTKDGAPYWIDLRIVPLRNAAGAIVHFAAIERDATLDRRRVDTLVAQDRDGLTGLPSRTAMRRVLATEIESGTASALCLAVIGADGVKAVNDEHGHAAGDAVLIALADRLITNVRRIDNVGRLGGDAFVASMPGVTVDEATRLASRLCEAVAGTAFSTLGGAVQVTVSIGLTALRDGDTVDSLLERGDLAMRAAKRAGRNRVMAEPA